jgi:hypothetical protein
MRRLVCDISHSNKQAHTPLTRLIPPRSSGALTVVPHADSFAWLCCRVTLKAHPCSVAQQQGLTPLTSASASTSSSSLPSSFISMLGFMPGASTLLTCLLALSTLGALAAPTPASHASGSGGVPPRPVSPARGRSRSPTGERPSTPPPGVKIDLDIQEKQHLMLYAHYAGAVYCKANEQTPEVQEFGGGLSRSALHHALKM